jgi:Flp pilus assembly protein CpaB
VTFGAPATDRRPGSPVDRWWRELRAAVVWRRRLLAAGLLAGSVAVALHALAPPPPPRAAVLVAARDLPAGRTLATGDLRVVRLPQVAVPAGALTSVRAASGAEVATAVRRGEVLTDVRLAGSAALRGLSPGVVAAPVRLADAGVAALLRPGDVVDVLAAGAGDGSAARLVASTARVLSVPSPSPAGALDGGGTLVLLATTSATAARLAAAAVTDRLSVVLRSA